MRRINRVLDAFAGVGYGQNAQIVLDAGPTYGAIILETKGIEKDQLENISLTLNGRPLIDVHASFFKSLDGLKANPVAGNIWVIQFANYDAKSNAGQRLRELVTLAGDNLVLKVRIGSARAGQTGTPSLSGYSITTASRPERMFLPKILGERIPIGATGLNNYKTYARGARIFGMHLQSADITAFEVHRNRLLLHEMTAQRNKFELSRAGLVPQAGFYHFYPIATGFEMIDALRTTGQSLEFKPTVSKAGDISVIFETLEVDGQPHFDPIDFASQAQQAQQ